MTMLERLARRGHRAAAAVLDAFNPDQERDENGRWTGGDGAIAASRSARTPAEHAAAEKLHREANAKAPRFSHEAQMHWNAALAHMSLSQTFNGGSVFAEAPKVSSGLSEFLGGPRTPARGTAAQINEHGGKVDFQTALKMTSGSTRRMVASGNDPRTTSSHEQDKMEARQLASGERIPLKQGPTQAGGYKGNPAAEGSRAVKSDDLSRNAHKLDVKASGIEDRVRAAAAHHEAAKAHLEAAQSMSVSDPRYSTHMGGHYSSLNQARKLETEIDGLQRLKAGPDEPRSRFNAGPSSAQEKYRQMLKSKETMRKAWEPLHTARATGLSQSTIRKGDKKK